MGERGESMNTRKKIWLIPVLFVLSLLAGYMAYDFYFRLPDFGSVADGTHNQEEYSFGKFNILVLGLDGRKGINDRTDTIILASLDEKNKKAQLLSIPRDSRVKIKGGYDKINAAYAYGGLDLTKVTVEDFLNVKIDRYVIIKFNSMVKVVDLLGGIDVDVPVRMYKPLEGIDLKPGMQHLNGKQVLAYARFRGTKNGDIDRAQRQQEVIKLLAKEMLQGKNLKSLPALINQINEDVDTDLTVKEMGALARLASDVMKNGISAKVLPGENKKIDGLWYWEADLSQLAEYVDLSNQKSVADSGSSEQS
jgi:LCP family protein required for cell wall assembly